MKVDEGFLNMKELSQAIAEAKLKKLSLFDYLITKDILDCDVFAKATAENFGYPLFELTALDPGFARDEALKEELIAI